MKAVFLDWQSLDRDDLDPQSLLAAVDDYQVYGQTLPGQVLERMQGTQVVISNKVVLSREVLTQCPGLQLICVAATGTNNIDLEAARELGIAVSNVRAYGTASVAQHVFALMIALSNRLLDYVAAVRHGDWSRSEQFCLLDYPICEISGKTLGIVGYGELGQAVARLAEAFGMRVLIAARDEQDSRPGRIPLDSLLPQVDVLSLHCPLTEDNHNLISREQLSRMQAHALLINTARGGLVDEAALAQALLDGRLGGAALDVLAQEPPPVDHPLCLGNIPNLIVTPHVAWASRESRQRMVDQLADNITAFKGGQLQNRVV